MFLLQIVFSESYSHFPISAIFGEFGVIFCDFCKKICGDVI